MPELAILVSDNGKVLRLTCLNVARFFISTDVVTFCPFSLIPGFQQLSVMATMLA